MIDQEAVVREHSGIIDFVLRRLAPVSALGESSEDDWQDGFEGLIHAASLFESERGVTFMHFAKPWVRWYVQQGRGRRLGANYRRARTRGAFYHDPYSLDYSLDGREFVDILVAPPLIDESFRRCPEPAEMIELLNERDRIAILHPAVVAAEKLGISRAGVLKRRVRAYARLRERVAA